MCTRRILPNIAEAFIHRDQDTLFTLAVVENQFITLSRQPLRDYGIGNVAFCSQPLCYFHRQVLIYLEAHYPVRGSNCSFANSAAYAKAA